MGRKMFEMRSWVVRLLPLVFAVLLTLLAPLWYEKVRNMTLSLKTALLVIVLLFIGASIWASVAIGGDGEDEGESSFVESLSTETERRGEQQPTTETTTKPTAIVSAEPQVPGKPELTVHVRPQSNGTADVTLRLLVRERAESIVRWEVRDGGMPGPTNSDDDYHTWKAVPPGDYLVSARACSPEACGAWSETLVDVPEPEFAPATPRVAADFGWDESGAIYVTARWEADDNGTPISRWLIDPGGLPGRPVSTATSFKWEDDQAGVGYGDYVLTVAACNTHGCSQPMSTTIEVPKSAKLSHGDSAAGVGDCSTDNDKCLFMRVDINFKHAAYHFQCVDESENDDVWFDSRSPDNDDGPNKMWPMERRCYYGIGDGHKQYVRILTADQIVETNRLAWPRR
ncbi:MAG: hypothetical protein F4X49_00580 [Acidimicrobiia bacterium]|nr:hypothetical protein [Acidimicrobiia bacterium]